MKCKYILKRDGDLIWCDLKQDWIYIQDCLCAFCDEYEEE